MEPELVADYACHVGEGPLWHPGEQRLYWTDITAGRMFWYEPSSGRHEQCYEGEPVGGMTMQADGALLLFMARGAVKLWRATNPSQLTTVIEDIPAERHSRFNDVIADPGGRVFCGTMPSPDSLGRLYRLNTDRTLDVVLVDIGCANGMGFTGDRRHMYFTDSTPREIYVLNYDTATGLLGNQRLWLCTPEGQGVPDGMTVDAEGCVWSARWDGGCLVRYAPDGTEMQRIPFPARKVSSATFGGPDYADLYVTTAGGEDRAANGPGAGALFHLTPGVRGVPEFPSRIKVG